MHPAQKPQASTHSSRIRQRSPLFASYRIALIMAVTLLPAHAAEYWWDGQANHNNWRQADFTGSNWRHSATSNTPRTDHPGPHDEIFFAANDPDAGSFNTFLGEGRPYVNVLSVATTLNLGHNVIINPTVVFNNLNTRSGGITTNNSRSITINATVNTNIDGYSSDLNLTTNPGTIRINTNIEDVDAINKYGSGTAWLTADNTHPGNTTVHGGTLQIGAYGTPVLSMVLSPSIQGPHFCSLVPPI